MITASSVKFQHLLPWQKQFGAFQQLHHHKMALTRTQKRRKKEISFTCTGVTCHQVPMTYPIMTISRICLLPIKVLYLHLVHVSV